MSANIPSVQPGSGSAPVRPVALTSRGVAVGTGASSQSGLNLNAPLLGRSGIDVLQLLTDGDTLTERSVIGRVELNARLEAARGALVRNMPAEALALLDDGWEGARTTEQGWYLRGSALAVLGLPGEAVRVASEALQHMPTSLALRYLSSLVRLLVGDNAGARALLQSALADAPDEPVLLAHQTILLARAGRNNEASLLLTHALARHPNHPAIAYAKAWIGSERAQTTRGLVRQDGAHGNVPSATQETPHATLHANAHSSVHATSRESTSDVNSAATGEPVRATTADSIESLFQKLGTQLRGSSITREQLVLEMRLVLRAISTGGSLASAGTSEQSHIARSLISSMLTVWSSSANSTVATSPIQTHDIYGKSSLDAQNGVYDNSLTTSVTNSSVLRELLTLIRNSQLDEARKLLIRSETSLPSFTRSLIRAMLGDNEPRTSPRASTVNAEQNPFGVHTDRARHDAIRGVIGPVRLGLSLVDETKTVAPNVMHTITAAALAASATSVNELSTGRGNDSASKASELAIHEGEGQSISAHGPVGWDAIPRPAQLRDSRRGAHFAAIFCVLAATAAVASGQGAFALPFAGGAIWIALRRTQRLHDTAEYHTVEKELNSKGQ